MANIGDVFMRMVLEGSEFVASAGKMGAKAGDAAGSAMSKSLKAAALGAGIEVGRQALHRLEDAISAVTNAIPDMIQQGRDFALTVDDISDKTGASAETASRFAGTLTYLGIATSGLGMSLKTLSTEIVTNEDKFRRLGIQTRDSNGNLLDTITILNNVRGYLSGAGDGATKMALAADLLGRSAGELIDFLNLTDEQAAALGSTLDDLGVTIGERARKDAESLARETNLLGLAWQGLSNTLFMDVAPAIRTVIGGATQFIKEHGAEIRQTLIDITNAALGFVSALVGIEGVTPFQTQLDALSSSAGNVTLSFEQWAQQTGRTIPKLDQVADSTKAGTTAIDRQIASIDKQIERSKARDDADEAIFGRTMKRLAGEYGAQLDALDLAEQQIAIDARRRDLNAQLNEAQLALTEAQGGTDAQAISDAMARVAEIRAQQAENERRLAVDAQRARLEATKSYIEDVARLESESDNKSALAKTLKRRDEKLTADLAVAQEAKNADAIADITAKLEAVKTAEERTAQAIRAQDKQSELATLKAQLAAQRQAISDAGSGQVADNKKTLAELKAQYQAYLADQAEAIKTHILTAVGLIKGDPKVGTGLGGALTKAFADGQAAGEAFRSFLTDQLGPALQAILGIAQQIAAVLGDQGLSMAGGALVGARIGGLPGAVIGGAVGGTAAARPGTLLLDPGGPLQGLLEAYDAVFGTNYSGTHPTPGRAAGGPVMRGQPFIGNEKRQEFFVPDQSGTIIPSLDALRGWMGGDQTIEVPVYLDGDVITRVVARRLGDEYHR